MNIVAKFGGSCITAQNLGKVKEVVGGNPYIKYAVVSAVGKISSDETKVTDLLIEYHRSGEKKTLQKIIEIHLEIAEKYSLGRDMEKIILRALGKSRRYDYVISRGEYFSGVLVSRLLGWRLIDTKKLVKFDFARGLDAEKSSLLLKKALPPHGNAVITGFYGSDPVGRTVAFSRGGSDITGSLVADAADAVLYENWTDVDGFLIANPSKVFNPRPIECISYAQLSGLNRIGADVLHPFTVLPLVRKSIPLHIRNIYNPYSPGTLVTQTANKNGLLAITSFETNYLVYDRPMPQKQFAGAKFFHSETATRVLAHNIPDGPKPKISAKAEYIQAVYYGKADLGEIAKRFSDVYFVGRTENTLSFIIAPQKNAVQSVYDYFM